MTKLRPIEAFFATQGRALSGYSKVMEIADEMRHLTVYRGAENELLLAFDCTKGNIWPPSRDWLMNLVAWPSAFTFGSLSCKAHAGFVAEYLSMRAEVQQLIRTWSPSVILISGFSQGAAHATLCWRDLVHASLVPIHGIVFASPRVYTRLGAKEFGRTLRANQRHSFLRFALRGDPFTGLPPWIIGYRHVGTAEYAGPWRLPSSKVHSGSLYAEALESG